MAEQGRKKPNILVIMGDDIGWFNPSIYNRGMMGYRTPNIDRIGNEGAMFTDWYGQQSCTAGRAAFITGQSPDPHRPHQGRPAGRRHRPPAPRIRPSPRSSSRSATCAGSSARTTSATRTSSCRPCTASTSSSATSTTSTPKRSRRIRSTRRIRGSRRCSARAACFSCKASDKDDPTEQPRWGRVGKQTIEDTGPLTKKRMETVDEEFVGAALDFIDRQAQGEQAVLLWFNTHPHARLDAPQAGIAEQDRPGHLCGRHGRTGRLRRPAARQSSTSSASPTTRSWCSRPTTAPRC